MATDPVGSREDEQGSSRQLSPEQAAAAAMVADARAPTADAALAVLDELDKKWGRVYPAMIRLWCNAWTEFVPFLDYDVEIRAVLCSTNAIKSLNARHRRAVGARGHLPSEQAALKYLYRVTAAPPRPGRGGHGGRSSGNR